MEIKFSLSDKEIKGAIRELKAYKKSLQVKCETFVARLANEGIAVASQNTGDYGRYITFGKEIDKEKYGASCIMYATSGTLCSTWLVKDPTTGETRHRSADISPLLMAEFGTGQFAASDKTTQELGMGRGSFWPNANYYPDRPEKNNALQQDGWWWMDLNGEWQHTEGQEPTSPMFNALLDMEMKLFKIAREVFGT